MAALPHYTKKLKTVFEILDEWESYIKQRYSPNEIYYYYLTGVKILSLLELGQVKEANREYNVMHASYINHIDSQSDLDNIFLLLETSLKGENKNIKEIRKDLLKSSKDAAISQLFLANYQKALYAETKTSKENLITDTRISETWENIILTLQSLLSDYYYNLSDISDESDSNETLFYLFTCTNIFSENLHDREDFQYDNLLIAKNFIESQNAKSNREICSWQNVQATLDSDEIAIEISTFPDEVLLLGKDYSHPVSIKFDSLLIKHIASLAINEPYAINELYKPKGALYTLWEKIKPYMNNIKTIYISGSSLFTQISFAAIPLEDSTILSDKYIIYHLESTSQIKQLKNSNRQFEIQNIHIYGDMNYNLKLTDTLDSFHHYTNKENSWELTRGVPDIIRGEFKPLPGSKEEIKAIDNLLTKMQINHTVVKKDDASEESFKNISGKKIDIIHVSTHGFMLCNLFNGDFKKYTDSQHTKYETILSQSGLLFSGANQTWKGINIHNTNDGILTSKEIATLDLHNVKLVVLAACDTGLGETTNSRGLSYGVHSAIKEAGANKCLVCLWKISDKASVIFFTDFYSNLFKLHDANLALKVTQDGFRRSTEYNSPYYWAPYVIIN